MLKINYSEFWRGTWSKVLSERWTTQLSKPQCPKQISAQQLHLALPGQYITAVFFCHLIHYVPQTVILFRSSRTDTHWITDVCNDTQDKSLGRLPKLPSGSQSISPHCMAKGAKLITSLQNNHKQHNCIFRNVPNVGIKHIIRKTREEREMICKVCAICIWLHPWGRARVCTSALNTINTPAMERISMNTSFTI